MPFQAGCTDADFAELIRQFGASETARRIGISVNGALKRRRRLEKRTGCAIISPKTPIDRAENILPFRRAFDVENGIVIVFSDAHYWPGLISTAHRAPLIYIDR